MSIRRGLSGAALAAVVLVMSTACASEGTSPTGSPTPTSTTATATPTPTPTPTATADPLISIDMPTAGSTVATPVEMSGTANTFEAALTVDALDAAGTQLCVRSIMATSGSGTPGTWQTTLAFPPPAKSGPITLRAYDYSAKDGSMENLVERKATVSADHPAIFITSPTCGQQIAPGSTLTVKGRALVFEAMFTLELRNAAGATIVNTEVTAESGTEESDFTATMALPADAVSGYYDLVAFDNSAKDGTVIDEFSIQLRLQ